MAKRFTDTNKWKDTWFQDLPTKYKLFWIYILDECDAAGLWKPNMRLASFQIGEPFEEAELKRVFINRITITDEGYWFVSKFIEFQYGELSANSKPHLSVINLLKRHKIKGYTKGIDTLKEKEKDKDKEKVKDLSWYKSQFDEIYLESMAMTHKGKDINQAILESYNHLAADDLRLHNAESSDCKKLLNTWLSKQSINKGFNYKDSSKAYV
jgi:hypothetical protein